MLIHGRLVLTSSGLMLDEVRSLLQKALRRKESHLVLSSCCELLGRGKDQLPWKSLVTFLFEDHCLSDPNILSAVHNAYVCKDKYRAVEVLLQAHTCRVAACLPVVAMCSEYHPKALLTDCCVPTELQGLLTAKVSNLNFDLILTHVQAGWIASDDKKLIAAVKLATLVDDYEERTLTQKGQQYLIEAYKGKGKPSVTLLVLSTMFKATKDPNLRRYIYFCYKFAMIPDMVTRLLVFAPVAYLLFKEKIKVVDLKKGQVDWSAVVRLNTMPNFAVDKHTFRGKFGKGTKHLVKKKPVGMTDNEYEEFHGARPKKDIKDFFNEGVKCNNETLSENPFWESAKQVYFKQTPRMQKTLRMSKEFYSELHIKIRSFFHEKKCHTEIAISKNENKNCIQSLSRRGVKRPQISYTELNNSDSDFEETKPSCSKRPKLNNGNNLVVSEGRVATSPKKVKPKPLVMGWGSVTENGENVVKRPIGPLLQLPTGSGKVYTCLDTNTKDKVWKGPYKREKMAKALFYHKAMSNLFLDPHTMSVEVSGSHLVFPLWRAPGSRISLTKKDYFDAIQKKDIKDGEFLLRDTLGIIQLHKLPVSKIGNLPCSIWAHFLYRFCLDIGDSGLYNAITDETMSFLFGIDMEENRGSIKSHDLMGLMFVKAPSKMIYGSIKAHIKSHKAELVKIMSRTVNYAELDQMASSCGSTYDKDVFSSRLTLVQKKLAAF